MVLAAASAVVVAAEVKPFLFILSQIMFGDVGSVSGNNGDHSLKILANLR